MCETEFYTQQILESHIRNIHGFDRRYFKCDSCEKVFHWKGRLNRHVKEVHNKAEFKCESCEKSFSRKSSLRDHITFAHDANKKYKCEKCLRPFLEHRQLKKHLLTAHVEDN